MDISALALAIVFVLFLVCMGVLAVRQSSETARVATPNRPASLRESAVEIEAYEDRSPDIAWAPEVIAEAAVIASVKGPEEFDTFAAPLVRTRREGFDFRVATFNGLTNILLHDGHLDDEGLQQLRMARDVLRLPREVCQQILQEVAAPIIVARVEDAMADRRVTIEEARSVMDFAERAGFTLDVLDLPNGLLFARFYAYAQWEAGKLDEWESPFTLEAMEKCHWATPAELVERVPLDQLKSPSRLTLVPPITHGAQYRSGGLAPNIGEQARILSVDTGTLVMTSKRLVFWGNERTESQNWVNVRAIRPFADAIEVERRLGHPFTVVTQDAEGAAVMASVLMRKRDTRWGR